MPIVTTPNSIIIGVDLDFTRDPCATTARGVSPGSVQVPGSVRDEFIRKALNVYRETPGNSKTTNQSDAVLAGQWYDQKIAIETVENALILGAFRRYCNFFNAVLFNNSDTHPPPLVHSLKYFQGVVEEVRDTKVSADYYQHIRRNMESYLQQVAVARDRAAVQNDVIKNLSESDARVTCEHCGFTAVTGCEFCPECRIKYQPRGEN
jgi:hypothetical protein